MAWAHRANAARRTSFGGLKLARSASWAFACALLLSSTARETLSQSRDEAVEPTRQALISSFPESLNAPATTISAENVKKYSSLLPSEVLSLVEEGVWGGDALRRSPYVWRYDDGWESRSAESQGTSVNADGSLAPFPAQLDRFPFTTSEAQAIPTGSNGSPLLWNYYASWLRFGYTGTEVSASVYENRQIEHRYHLQIDRQSPHLTEGGAAKVLFRESIAFSAPEPLRALTWLTYRFKGQDEDAVWIRSPATGRVRQVTESNRGDPLFEGFPSARDLIGWWGKVERGEATVTGRQPILVPLELPEIITAEGDTDNCWRVRQPPAVGTPPRPWLQRRVLLVPRVVTSVDLLSSDPFARHARERFYLDAHSFLPVYRSLYDQAGQLERVIVTTYALATAADRSLRFPVVSSQLVWEPLSERLTALHVAEAKVCPFGTNPTISAIFSPRDLAGTSVSGVVEKAGPVAESDVKKDD